MKTDFLKKLKGIKGIGFILLIFAVCVVLLLWPTSDKSDGNAGEFGYLSTDEYLESLESDVEKLLCGLDGVKKCTVLITLENGFEYHYAADQQQNGDDVRREYILANYGGSEQPVLIKERMPVVSGVAVVCPGIGATAEYKVIKLLSALFNIGPNRISVTG